MAIELCKGIDEHAFPAGLSTAGYGYNEPTDREFAYVPRLRIRFVKRELNHSATTSYCWDSSQDR